MINYFCHMCKTFFAVEGTKLHLVAGIGVTCPICQCNECTKVVDILHMKRELEALKSGER